MPGLAHLGAVGGTAQFAMVGMAREQLGKADGDVRAKGDTARQKTFPMWPSHSSPIPFRLPLKGTLRSGV
jgi:hypothetical protein